MRYVQLAVHILYECAFVIGLNEINENKRYCGCRHTPKSSTNVDKLIIGHVNLNVCEFGEC